MRDLIRTTFIGFLVGMGGTGLGGTMAFILKNPSRRFLSGIIGLSGGLMIAIVTFELLPEAFMIGGVPLSVAGLSLGTCVAAGLDNVIGQIGRMTYKNQGYIKTAILLGIGIALHNFPEGLAIGSGLVAQSRLGIGLAVVIAFHNMPEGVAMVTPLRVGGYGKAKAFFLTLIAGAPMGLGAYFGALIGSVAYRLIGVCLAFAGGTMLYITFGELIPKGKTLDGGKISTLCAALGFILGMLISKTF